MRTPTSRPALVRNRGASAVPARARTPPDAGTLLLLLAVSLVPIVGELARAGRWDAGSVGVATAVAILSGRELWHEVLDARRGG